jgi:hypothetical protein
MKHLKLIIGVAAGLGALALVVGLLSGRDHVVNNPDSFKRVEVVTITGKATREFVTLCENPEVRKILKEKHKIVPNCAQATSADTVKANAGEGGQDFLVPASDLMATTYPGKSLQIQPVFSSPVIVFTKASHGEALVKKGFAKKQDDGSLLMSFGKLAMEVEKRTDWKSLGVNEYGPIKIRSTSLDSTTSGQGMTHLLTAAFNKDEPVTPDTMTNLVGRVKPIVDRFGQLPKTTNDLLNLCLSTGCSDLNFGLESTYLRIFGDFANGDAEAKKSAEAMKKNLTILYPEPAAWGHHTMIVLTENGRRLLKAMSDPEILAIAWKEHGLRTPGQGIRMDVKSTPVPGVAVTIGAGITQPTAENNTAFIKAVLGK